MGSRYIHPDLDHPLLKVVFPERRLYSARLRTSIQLRVLGVEIAGLLFIQQTYRPPCQPGCPCCGESHESIFNRALDHLQEQDFLISSSVNDIDDVSGLRDQDSAVAGCRSERDYSTLGSVQLDVHSPIPNCPSVNSVSDFDITDTISCDSSPLCEETSPTFDGPLGPDTSGLGSLLSYGEENELSVDDYDECVESESFHYEQSTCIVKQDSELCDYTISNPLIFSQVHSCIVTDACVAGRKDSELAASDAAVSQANLTPSVIDVNAVRIRRLLVTQSVSCALTLLLFSIPRLSAYTNATLSVSKVLHLLSIVHLMLGTRYVVFAEHFVVFDPGGHGSSMASVPSPQEHPN